MKMELNMEDKLSRFYKFIIRKIVNAIEYNPKTDEYKINRVTISDDLLQRIIEEGSRYGLSNRETLGLVNQVSMNVVTKPYKRIYKGQFKVSNITIGQHFEIHFIHPDKGANFIELLCIEETNYIVLNSSISGLRILDKLIPVSLLWNTDFFIDFLVYRNNKRYPDGKTILHLGKYTHTLICEPPVIYEILDSDESFSFKDKQAIKSEYPSKKGERKAFVWTPNLMNPIAFTFNGDSNQDEKATFVITFSDDSLNANLSLNKDFELPTDKTQREYLLQVIKECCKCRNNLSDVESFRYIRTIRTGVLQKDIKEKTNQRWILVNKPQIKFIFQ